MMEQKLNTKIFIRIYTFLYIYIFFLFFHVGFLSYLKNYNESTPSYIGTVSTSSNNDKNDLDTSNKENSFLSGGIVEKYDSDSSTIPSVSSTEISNKNTKLGLNELFEKGEKNYFF